MIVDDRFINQTIDNTSGYIVYLLKGRTALTQKDMIKKLYKSQAFQNLNDREMKYYCDNHRLILELFLNELS
jgi:hypothetical protein